MHDAITPLDNPFIQHMLFDPYIKEENGKNSKIVASAFNLEEYIKVDRELKNTIISYIKTGKIGFVNM